MIYVFENDTNISFYFGVTKYFRPKTSSLILEKTLTVLMAGPIVVNLFLFIVVEN